MISVMHPAMDVQEPFPPVSTAQPPTIELLAHKPVLIIVELVIMATPGLSTVPNALMDVPHAQCREELSNATPVGQ